LLLATYSSYRVVRSSLYGSVSLVAARPNLLPRPQSVRSVSHHPLSAATGRYGKSPLAMVVVSRGGGTAWSEPARLAAATLQRGPAYSGGPFFAAMSEFTEGMGAVRQPGDRSRSECSPDPPASRRRYSAPLPCRPAIRRAGSDRLQPARP
jgi:hypothetical protein